MSPEYTHQIPVDPRRNHPYSQIIRRVDAATLPRGVIAQYDPVDNILRVSDDDWEHADDHQKRRMLECTDVLYR